jgi:hypothetical protein
LAKEKRQQDIKFRFIEKAGIDDFIQYDESGMVDQSVSRAFVDQLKDRIDKVRDHDTQIKEFATKEKKKQKTKKRSGVELFMG